MLALIGLATLSPPVRSRGKGALLVLEALPSPVRPLAALTPEPRRTEIAVAEGRADLYRPRGFSSPPGIVLVHGANPRGKDDPRVVGLAGALARGGRQVLVPQLGLRNRRLDLEDPRRIRAAVRLLAVRGRVGVMAFSYGAGLSLVALVEEPELQRRVAFVATVGTYFDLLHILQGVTTGTVPYRGRTVGWRTVPEARDLVAEQLAEFSGGAPGAALREAWKTRDPSGLDAEGRAIYELLANRDPERVAELASALPERLRDLLAALSPSRVADAVSVPIYALHARNDPAAPPTESRLLVEAVRGRVDARYFEVDLLEHVSPVASPLARLGDARRLAAFAGIVLRAQEGWPRP